MDTRKEQAARAQRRFLNRGYRKEQAARVKKMVREVQSLSYLEAVVYVNKYYRVKDMPAEDALHRRGRKPKEEV